MLPKFMTRDDGFEDFHIPLMTSNNLMGGGMENNNSNNIVLPTNGTDIDSLLQVHRRKMLRRAANRRSAQLSRARKKAHMEDLKVENNRLQRLVDILDSQPELLFCITMDGRITYLSDRTSSHVRISSPDCGDEDPIHMSQILTAESLDILFDSLAQISSNNGQNMYFSQVSLVREVFYHDMSGYPVAGYLRCAKVVRKNPDELGNVDMEPEAVTSKKNKKNDSSATQYRSNGSPLEEDDLDESTGSALLTSLSQGCHPSLVDFRIGTGYQYKEEGAEGIMQYAGAKRPNPGCPNNGIPSGLPSDEGEEVVCVIRPADMAFPQGGHHTQVLSPLSAASMVAHEREHRAGNSSACRDANNRKGHYSNISFNTGGHYPSETNDSSDSNCNSNKNSTSSEAGSDDTGENDANSA